MSEDTHGVCNNALSITGRRLELTRFKEMAWKNAKSPDVNGGFIRMPTSPVHSSRNERSLDLQLLAANAHNVMLFETADELIYWFATAAGPPIATLVAASAEYAALYFDLMFQLRNSKRNGRVKIKSGVVIFEKWFATASRA
jgi:hypothetical protein